MSQRATRIADRAIGFLYFYAVTQNAGANLGQIVADFKNAGLGNPNITKLRNALAKDRRTTKVARDEWRLKSDKIADVEKEFLLDRCLNAESAKPAAPSGVYVDKKRFQALKRKMGKFDFSRLLQMLSELDHAFASASYISAILLVRAILDHVSPILGFNTFGELANNYDGTRSFKDSMLHLENSSRKIADAYLHTRIRSKESLPNGTQVNFSNDLDVLLAEIIRVN